MCGESETPGTPPPPDLSTPKRGAFPTPKEEIESAKPYIPESDQAGDQSADQKDNGRGNSKAPEPK